MLMSITLSLPLAAEDDGQSPSPAAGYSIIPPSPEVASLVKFNDIPVSCFNGLPDINLPLWEIKEGNLSVPISIMYHGGGIRVDEMEGNLGLGWSLNAGAVVSRTVYGLPDDANTNIKGLFHIDSSDRSLREQVMEKQADYNPINVDGYLENRVYQADLDFNYRRGTRDMANDIFKMAGLGLSGTFAFDDNRDMVLSSAAPVEIEPSTHVSGDLYAVNFSAVDSHGTEYSFSTKEETVYRYSYGFPGLEQTEDSLRYVSAWHLTKIKSITNDSITYTYSDARRKMSTGGTYGVWYQIDNDRLKHLTPAKTYSSGTGIYYPKLLTRIENGSSKAEIFYGEDRSGGYGLCLIDSINVVTKGSRPERVKHFVFSYKTFPTCYNPSGLTERRRVFLERITLNGDLLYKFEYMTDENKAIPFTGNDQDFCGYFNGAGNKGLIPYVSSQLTGEAASRDVDPEVAALGVLTSIVYPTGGESRLEWESNEYGYLGGAQITSSDVGTATVLSAATDTLCAVINSEARKLEIKNFKVSSGQRVELDLSSYFNINPQLLWGSEYYNEHDYTLHSIYPSVYFVPEGSTIDECDTFYYIDEHTVETLHGGQPFEIPIEAGTYTVVLRYPLEIGDSDYVADIERQFLYDYGTCARVFINRVTKTGVSTGSVTHKDLWGGLRIRRIKSVSGSDTPPVIKDYFYNHDFSPESCSGSIEARPYFNHQYYLLCPHQQLEGIDCTDVQCVGTVGLRSSPEGTAGVEYPYVSVRYSGEDRYEPTDLHNYAEKFYYSSCRTPRARDYNPTEFLNFQPVAAQMWTSQAFRRGDIAMKTTGAAYATDTVSYEYDIQVADNLKWLTTDLFVVADMSSISYGGRSLGLDYSIGRYQLIPYNKHLKSETRHEKDGIDSTVRYEYFYDGYTDNADSGLVKSITVTDASGDSETTYYTYAKIGERYIDMPETEVTVNSGKITKAVMMLYDSANRLSQTRGLSAKGLSAADYGLGSKSASAALRSVISMPGFAYEYDPMGNVCQISYRGEVLASYLWGYMGSHPIVEAKRLPYSKLVSALGSCGYTVETILSSSFTEPAQLKNLFSSLRAALPKEELTTITYHWLLGISESVDQRGVRTSFSIDNQGRLTGVKDFNDYYIRKYMYHLKELE